jgi:tRNA threonylcarbamoyladenosine biosynthesis protein TsaE
LKGTPAHYVTASVEETVWLGEQLGTCLRHGDVVALVGDLGGGKTWFTKGVALGLGIDPDTIVSPTFTIVNEYDGTHKLFHIDLYRLKDKTEIEALELDEYLSGKGVVVVEWADRWPRELPRETVVVALRMVDDHTRELRFSASHARAREILHALKQKIGLPLPRGHLSAQN